MSAEAGVVDVLVEGAELLARGRLVAERRDHGETAVGLLDVGVEAANAGPLGDEQPLRTSRDRPRRQQ